MSDCLDGVPKELADQVKASPDKKKFVQDLRVQNARKYKLLKMQKVKHAELSNLLEVHPKGAVSALRSILTNDLYGLAKNSNVEYRTHAIVGQVHAKMIDTISALSTKKFGATRNVKLADDVVLEIFGTNTKNKKASKLAKQWADASSSLRERFNKAGGSIDKLDSWGMPQSHAQPKVSKAGVDKWITFIRPLLRDADELDLNKIYETISTGGSNKLRDGGLDAAKQMGGGKMFANKNNEPRSLHFIDGESWLKYQKEFGREDPLSVMLDHVRALATDTAMVEILGPNPDNMFRTLAKDVELREQLDRGQSGFEGLTQAIYNVVSGKVDSSAAASTSSKYLEQIFGTARSIQTATKLGSAALSAMSDMGTMFTNVAYHGMNPAKVLHSFVKNFDIKNQEKIARLGFAADIFNSTISARFNETAHGPTAKAAEAVIRASGMSIWTESARKTFQYEFYNHLKDVSKESKLNDLYKRYGWNKEDVVALDFDSLTLTQETRILEMVNQETDYAVLMPTARTRAITTGGAQKGTWLGELVRSGMMFKSFPASFMIQQISRSFLQGSLESRLKYGAMLFTSTTILGGLAMTAKDASKGYDSRAGNPLNEDEDTLKDKIKWWAASIVQGGGAGILGDILFSDQNRYGGGVATTLAGPLVGTLERFTKLTAGNIQQALDPDDESTNFGSEAVEFVNRELNPLNLWYTKAYLERYVVDNLKLFLDDDYEEAQMKKERKKRREYGQEKFDVLKPAAHNAFNEAQADVKALRGKYTKRYLKETDRGKRKSLSKVYKKDIQKIKDKLSKEDQFNLKVNMRTPYKRQKSFVKPVFKKQQMVKL